MPGATAATDLIDAHTKEYHRLIQELLSNSIADYHFVERSEPGEDCEGYVALLREIRYLPAALAAELKAGIDFSRFKELCRCQPRYTDKLAISDHEDYALPVGMMQSPFVELFMQRFTSLYARVGVTDFSPSVMKTLREIVPFKVGDAS